MNERKNSRIRIPKPVRNIAAIFILFFVFVLIPFRWRLFYEPYGISYSVAYDFEYEWHKRGGHFLFKYQIEDKEYEGSISLGDKVKTGIKLRKGSFTKDHKFLIKIPNLAKWDATLLEEYHLPDTTSIPDQPWDSIPQWILDIPRLSNGRIDPAYYENQDSIQ